MNRIEDYQAFVAIVEKGGLTAAAKQLRRSLQSVSRSLAALEREVSVELFGVRPAVRPRPTRVLPFTVGSASRWAKSRLLSLKRQAAVPKPWEFCE
jgi:hypothetical protein